MRDWLYAFGRDGCTYFGLDWCFADWWQTGLWPVVWILLGIGLLLAVLLFAVAYLMFWERRLIAFIQVRLGPNRLGPQGFLQPIADIVKLLLKELIRPDRADKFLYYLGPIMTITPAMAVWAVVPFGPDVVLANINAGLLYVFAIASLEVYGAIMAGWASNSKYPILGAMRASAQMLSYEIAMGICILVVLMVTGSLNLSAIVQAQSTGWFADRGINFLSWNWLPLLPIFVVYSISAVAETHRHPFDVVEGEAEIVAGHMVEYSGMGFALFFLAEYANMVLFSVMASVLFLGGWQAPLGFEHLTFLPTWLTSLMNLGWIWIGLKVFFLFSMFVWIRGTFPRFRYDQIMRLGWKIFIPVTLVWLVLVGIVMQTPWSPWK
ncbi:MAG: NADH-quinone oxidoreductase subunit NuoH [Brachymonas sp.]|nr:NADH-quinone oxidoreductase subunit NuoH [Brachymonas sp.]